MGNSNFSKAADKRKHLSWISLVLLSGWLNVVTTNAYSAVIKKEHSLYRNIIVDQQGDLRCLKFSTRRTMTSQSCIKLNSPQQLVFHYTRFLMASLLLNDKPQRILIIGLGGGTMSNALHQLLPNSQIDNIEIDPAVIKIAKKYFKYSENNKVKTYQEDGRIYIKRALLQGQQYDLIILDAYNGDYIPEHLMTVEFLEQVKSLLSDHGVVAANTAATNRLYHHESATYFRVFGVFFNLTSAQTSNRIILATISPLPTPQQLDQNSRKLAAKLLPFNVDIIAIRQLMSTTPDWEPSTRVFTDQYSPANLLKTD